MKPERNRVLAKINGDKKRMNHLTKKTLKKKRKKKSKGHFTIMILKRKQLQKPDVRKTLDVKFHYVRQYFYNKIKLALIS